MSISFKILGKPGRDNALYAEINSGTRVYKLLFDCGENLINKLPQSSVKAVDYLFFSHLHIDHVAGFDYFFRRNYDREKPLYLFGPPETAEIISSRMRGYKWNLHMNLPGSWYITEIEEGIKKTFLYKTSEAYREKHFIEETPFNNTLFENEHFYVNAALLNHGIPSAAYTVKEKGTLNINKEILSAMGLPHGAWLERLKDFSLNEETITVGGKDYSVKDLREKLLVKKEGESIAYMTDFHYDDTARIKGVNLIKNCGAVICESQYLPADKELADKNFHLTSAQAASLARDAAAKKLILFHISERYRAEDYPVILNEARAVFPETYLPEEWTAI